MLLKRRRSEEIAEPTYGHGAGMLASSNGRSETCPTADSQFDHAPLQGGPFHSEERGCTVRTANDPVGCLQSFGNVAALGFLQRVDFRCP